MEELAYHLGAGLGMSAIFFPLAYLALRKQLQLRFSWAKIAIAFAVSMALLGLLAGVTHNDPKPSYFGIARLIIAPLLCAGVIVGARVNSDQKNDSVRHGTLILSFAILIATYCIASVFRYQYFPNGAPQFNFRVNESHNSMARFGITQMRRQKGSKKCRSRTLIRLMSFRTPNLIVMRRPANEF